MITAEYMNAPVYTANVPDPLSLFFQWCRVIAAPFIVGTTFNAVSAHRSGTMALCGCTTLKQIINIRI